MHPSVHPSAQDYIDAAAMQSYWLDQVAKDTMADENTMGTLLVGHLPIITAGVNDVPTLAIRNNTADM